MKAQKLVKTSGFWRVDPCAISTHKAKSFHVNAAIDSLLHYFEVSLALYIHVHSFRDREVCHEKCAFALYFKSKAYRDGAVIFVSRRALRGLG